MFLQRKTKFPTMQHFNKNIIWVSWWKMILCIKMIIVVIILGCCGVSATPLVPIGDVNVLVVTDVHSWVAGRSPHNELLDADYGDVLSFYARLKAQLASVKKDLFFVMNGDFMDGTGLSTNPPVQLTSIIQQMPWDAVNIGNHELYLNSTIEYISKPTGFIDRWRGRYLTSNVREAGQGNNSNKNPLGSQYQFLHGEFSDSYILTFGFLYNMQRHSPLVIVERVEDVVQSEWFQEVLSGNIQQFDAILVLAHMDVVDPLVDVILSAIRTICGPDMPVQFITGHSHIRAYQILDPFSTSFEAGHYLDTIGFVSFPLKDTLQVQQDHQINDTATEETVGNLFSQTSTNTTYASRSQENITAQLFRSTFLNANKQQLQNVLNGPPLETKDGQDLSAFIQQKQKEMGLTRVLGCSPLTYYVDKGLDKIDSLWGLYSRGVINEKLLKRNESKIFVQNTGSLRYNLYVGEITETDLISVSPFNDTIFLVKNSLSGEKFIEAFGQPNYANGISYIQSNYIVVGNIIPNKLYDIYTNDFFTHVVTSKISTVTNETSIIPIPIDNGNVTINTGLLWRQFLATNFTCGIEIEQTETPTILKSLETFFIEMTWWKVLTLVLSLTIFCCFALVFFGPTQWFDNLHNRKQFPSDAQSVSSSGSSRFNSYQSDFLSENSSVASLA